MIASVDAASRAVRVAQQQYKGGIADYIRVLVAQQFLINEQSRLVETQGSAAQNLVTLYRALGGGWELRDGNDLVPADIKEQMREANVLGRHDQQRPPGPADAAGGCRLAVIGPIGGAAAETGPTEKGAGKMLNRTCQVTWRASADLELGTGWTTEQSRGHASRPRWSAVAQAKQKGYCHEA